MTPTDVEISTLELKNKTLPLTKIMEFKIYFKGTNNLSSVCQILSYYSGCKHKYQKQKGKNKDRVPTFTGLDCFTINSCSYMDNKHLKSRVTS